MPTRALLICGAFAAIQAIGIIALSPVTSAVAAMAPHVYAVVAGWHSVLPVLARLSLGIPGTATITSLLAALLASFFTPLGLLLIVPLVLGSAAFDLALPLRTGRATDSPRTRRIVLAGAAAGVILFLVSLPVFSAEHLTVLILTATLLGRLIGEIGAALTARVLWLALRRAGVLAASR